MCLARRSLPFPIRASLYKVSSSSLPRPSPGSQHSAEGQDSAVQSHGLPAPQSPQLHPPLEQGEAHLALWKHLPGAGEAATDLSHGRGWLEEQAVIHHRHTWGKPGAPSDTGADVGDAQWSSECHLRKCPCPLALHKHDVCWAFPSFVAGFTLYSRDHKMASFDSSKTKWQVCTTTCQGLDLGSEARRVLACITRREKCFLSGSVNNQVILTSKIWLGFWLGKSKPEAWSLLCQQNRLAWVWCSAFNKELLIE